MTLTVVVGGQFGSEGKGKIVGYLADAQGVDLAVRCGSTNSGHTVWRDGCAFGLRMVPAAFGSAGSLLALAPGSLIDIDVLSEEVRKTGIDRSRLVVDRNAVIIERADADHERASGLNSRLGSTQTGVGYAVARRVLRGDNVRIAASVAELASIATIADVSQLVNESLDQDARVVIEGTQGYGLSLYHTPKYPFATSRDTTAAAFLSEVGVGPRRVDNVVLCVRTFPIRVAGNSGPLEHEITWKDVTRRSGSDEPIEEFTTVTRNLRRVADFDIGIVKRAAVVNSATCIALHGADYIDYSNRLVRSYCDLTKDTRSFIEWLEAETNLPVALIGVGPRAEETIDRWKGDELPRDNRFD